MSAANPHNCPNCQALLYAEDAVNGLTACVFCGSRIRIQNHHAEILPSSDSEAGTLAVEQSVLASLNRREMRLAAMEKKEQYDLSKKLEEMNKQKEEEIYQRSEKSKMYYIVGYGFYTVLPIFVVGAVFIGQTLYAVLGVLIWLFSWLFIVFYTRAQNAELIHEVEAKYRERKEALEQSLSETSGELLRTRVRIQEIESHIPSLENRFKGNSAPS